MEITKVLHKFHLTMAESEEPPSKIRKIDRSEFSSGASPEAHLSPGNPEKSRPDDSQTPEVGQPQEANNGEEQPVLSKSQRKKLLKTQKWEAGKEYRRVQRREKHRAKQAKKAELRAAVEGEGSAEGSHEIPKVEAIEPRKRTRLRHPIQTPVALILDCDFDSYMTEKEIISLGAQVTRCYSENKNSSYRAHVAVSSFGGRMRQRFETVLTRNHEGWKGVTFHEDDFMAAAERLNVSMQGPEGGKLAGALAGIYGGLEGLASSSINEPKPGNDNSKSDEPVQMEGVRVSETELPTSKDNPSRKRSHSDAQGPELEPREAESATEPSESKVDTPVKELKPPSIIYLSSDSDYTLTDLEPNTSYIIGGIVDKNRHKGLCYKRACERGIRTAKLPIGDYMTMQGRSVLTINHVVEIMLRWLETGDWGEAFLSVIPKRKEAKLRIKKEDEDGETSVKDEEDAEAYQESGKISVNSESDAGPHQEEEDVPTQDTAVGEHDT